MRCERNRWQALDDARRAAEYPQIADDKIRRQILEQIVGMLCGPGIEIDWKETIPEDVRRRVDAAAKELDEVYEQLRRDGLLKSADGKSIPRGLFRQE